MNTLTSHGDIKYLSWTYFQFLFISVILGNSSGFELLIYCNVKKSILFGFPFAISQFYYHRAFIDSVFDIYACILFIYKVLA